MASRIPARRSQKEGGTLYCLQSSEPFHWRLVFARIVAWAASVDACFWRLYSNFVGGALCLACLQSPRASLPRPATSSCAWPSLSGVPQLPQPTNPSILIRVLVLLPATQATANVFYITATTIAAVVVTRIAIVRKRMSPATIVVKPVFRRTAGNVLPARCRNCDNRSRLPGETALAGRLLNCAEAAGRGLSLARRRNVPEQGRVGGPLRSFGLVSGRGASGERPILSADSHSGVEGEL